MPRSELACLLPRMNMKDQLPGKLQIERFPAYNNRRIEATEKFFQASGLGERHKIREREARHQFGPRLSRQDRPRRIGYDNHQSGAAILQSLQAPGVGRDQWIEAACNHFEAPALPA